MRYIGRNKTRLVWRLLLLTAVMAVCLGRPVTVRAYIQTQGTVVADSAVIRKEANANSNAIASILKGDTVTINNEETGADGAVWYKVFVDANTLGYVRGDLIQKEGSSGTVTIAPVTPSDTPSETTPAAPDSNNGGTSGSEVNKDLAVGVNTTVTPIQSQSASVTNDNVRVRAEASASAGIVTKVRQSTAITVNGQANGDDGKVWYRVSFIADGSEVSGFIRSDYVQLSEDVVVIDETASAPEEPSEQPPETVEPPVDTPPVNADYELVYEPDDAGINDWYLHNNIDNKKNKLSEILEAADANGDAIENAEAQMKKDKIIIIILAVILVFLALTVTLLLFKIRDMYYEDFGEYDDEEDEVRRPQNREPRTVKPVQKERPAARPRPVENPPRSQRPQSRPANGQSGTARTQSRPAGTQSRAANSQSRPAGTQNRPVNSQPRPAGTQNRNGAKPGKEAGWKPKNFMMEEDDMEFEFLNWDGEER